MKYFVFGLLFMACQLLFANSVLVGTWNGYIVQNYQEKDNAVYLNCTLFISSTTENKIAGTLEIALNHSNGKTYKSKANISGTIDSKTYSVMFIAEEFIYQDILPEKATWCLGIFKGGVFRSKTQKQFLFKGNYTTKCNQLSSLLVVYKQ